MNTSKKKTTHPSGLPGAGVEKRDWPHFRRESQSPLPVAQKKGREAKPLADQVAPAEEGDVLELDEYWTYVRQRSNKRWLWGALCRRTRQIVAFVIGPLGEDLRAALGKNSIGVSRKIELQ